MDAELDELSVTNVRDTEEIIVSQWREVSAGDKSHVREQVDEILRPLGLQTRLVVVERANSLALFFFCMTLSALLSLRERWSTGQLRDIVQSLFVFLSGAAVRVKRLTWPVSDYERCMKIHKAAEGKDIKTNL